jgi:hypothetical protein
MAIAIPAIPFSVGSVIPSIIEILFGSLTVWLSAQFVTGNVSLQNSVLFSSFSFIALILLRLVPIPSLPIINTMVVIEIAIKGLLAMKLFNTDFKRGVSIAGVQIIFDSMFLLPF